MLTNSATPLHKILQVPFGIKDGILYEPRQVELGKACECVCPECKRPLVAIHAKEGGQIPNFRHLPGNDCQHGLESAVHLAVKQLIAEQKKLYLPELIATISVTDTIGQTHCQQALLTKRVPIFLALFA